MLVRNVNGITSPGMRVPAWNRFLGRHVYPVQQEATMAGKLKTGDKVSWDTSQGKTHGTVEKEVTGTAKVKGHVAKASKSDPQYMVKSDKTGAKAVHKPGELKKG